MFVKHVFNRDCSRACASGKIHEVFIWTAIVKMHATRMRQERRDEHGGNRWWRAANEWSKLKNPGLRGSRFILIR